MIHKTLDSHQFENPEKPSALPPFLWITGLHPSILCQMGFFVRRVCPQCTGMDSPFSPSSLSSSTEPHWGNPFMTRPASGRADWALVWFWFWLLFPVFIGWLSVLLFSGWSQLQAIQRHRREAQSHPQILFSWFKELGAHLRTEEVNRLLWVQSAGPVFRIVVCGGWVESGVGLHEWTWAPRAAVAEWAGAELQRFPWALRKQIFQCQREHKFVHLLSLRVLQSKMAQSRQGAGTRQQWLHLYLGG